MADLERRDLERRELERRGLERRAFERYTRYVGGDFDQHEPRWWPAVFWTWTATHEGSTYVVVGIDPVASTPGYEVLAVYRRRSRHGLWRQKQWPKAVEDMPSEDQVQRWDRRGKGKGFNW
jgi:hypothetical protein